MMWRRIIPARRFSAAAAKLLNRGIWTVHPDTGIVSRNNEPLFQTIIGMEIHAQLDIPTKLFSSAPVVVAVDAPNQAVWPLDVAVPGVLPRLSQQAVQAAVLTAAACRCEISRTSRFERKHYAYADLPLGYQMTQQRWPVAKNGLLTCRRKVDPKHKQKKQSQEKKYVTVRIDRIQMEQDTGKTTTVTKRITSPNGTEERVTESLVDFNRAGCALVEIVFCPDIRSANDASSVVETLRDTMRYIGTCDGRMEEGSLRCDLNVSIAPLDGTTGALVMDDDEDNPFQDSLPPGTGHRVEVKNLNSMRQVVAAAEYEALRQAQVYTEGAPTERETRTFDARTGQTVTMRLKGGAVDYRFMPEPDLPPVVLNPETLNGMTLEEFLAETLPELPEQATVRLMEEYGLSEDVALVITGDPPAVAMYEEAVETAGHALGDSARPKKLPGTVANWLCNDLFALVKESAMDRGWDDELCHAISVQYSRVSGTQLGDLVALIVEGTVSTAIGKKILAVMYNEEIGKSPRDVANERGWKVISDLGELKKICREVLLDPQHQSQLEQYKQGGKHIRKMEKFFLGKIMAQSGGNAHPELLNDALKETLQELAPDVE